MLLYLFAAPEIMGFGSYDAKSVDVYSCGIMLYVMLYNAFPFSPTSVNNGKLQFPSRPRVSEDAQNLIKQILVGHKIRIKMAEMCTHPWVLQVCASAL